MATTSHIDYRKIDYDQLIDKPIIRTSAEIDTINVAGVYDKGDGKRIIVSVDGNNITQVIEEKNGYQERTSTNGGNTWGNRDVVVFSDANHKWDKVIISQNEPVAPVETTAWLNITDDSFNIYDGSAWHTIAGGGTTEVPYIPTFSGIMNGTTTTFTNSNIEAGDGIILVGTTSGHPAGLWEYNVSVGGFTINSTESEDHVAFKYLIVKSHGIAVIEQADEIEYDNANSGLNSDNVQDAIDELANKNPQVDTMPTASSENEGKIVQYVGDTNQYYTNAYFYKCIEDPENPGQYIWQEIPVSDNSAENISYDNTTSGMTATNVQDAIDEVQGSITTINTTLEEIQNIVEVTTMEEASAENEGNIIQYKGETTASFTQGYFYKSVETPGTSPVEYEWVRIDVQPNTGGGEDIIYVTQAEYDLVPAADKADPTKHYAVYEDATGSGIPASDVDYDNTISGATATNIQDAMDEVFQSVSNGKTLIAAAITDKGVPTAATDSFSTMATNISNIDTGGQNNIYGDGSDGDLIIDEDTRINAREYNFNSLTVCDGATLSFQGQGTPIIRAKQGINNYGTIDARSIEYISNSTVDTSIGGEIVTVGNTGNLGYITVNVTQSGGCGQGNAGNGGGSGENGFDSGTSLGGSSALCAGGGGAGGCSGNNGCDATEYVGGDGGKGASGGNGGGGGYGYSQGGKGGQGGTSTANCGTYGGNGGDSFWLGGNGGAAGYNDGQHSYNNGNTGGKGGDAMGTLECFIAGCYAVGGTGGNGGQARDGHGGNGGIGGNVMYGCGGVGGCGGCGMESCGNGGRGGDAYCGRGGNGGNSYCTCYLGGNGGRGGNVVFGYGGNGGSGRTGGRGGDAIFGTGGHGGDTGLGGTYGDGGNVYHGTAGTGNTGGCALGGIYGLYLISPNISNNTILSCGSNGGNGLTRGGNGGNGGNVVIRYGNNFTQGCIKINGGGGGNGCSSGYYGNDGQAGSLSIKQICIL